MNGSRSQTTVFFLLLGIALLGLAVHQTAGLDPLEERVLDAVAPAQAFVTRLTNRVNTVIETARQLETLQEENRVLRELVDQLMIENVKLKDETRELAFLREELQFKRNNPTFDIRTADVLGTRVIAGEPNNGMATVTIDVGAMDGVRKGMPVVRAGALVGRIIQVGQRASRVLLITDPLSKVNARIQSSGVTGIVTGSVDGRLRLTHIPPEAEVHVGDIVITSGLGGNFPERLVIGQVIRVHKRDVEPFQEAELHPAADFSALEIVSVIRDFTPHRFEELK